MDGLYNKKNGAYSSGNNMIYSRNGKKTSVVTFSVAVNSLTVEHHLDTVVQFNLIALPIAVYGHDIESGGIIGNVIAYGLRHEPGRYLRTFAIDGFPRSLGVELDIASAHEVYLIFNTPG